MYSGCHTFNEILNKNLGLWEGIHCSFGPGNHLASQDFYSRSKIQIRGSVRTHHTPHSTSLLLSLSPTPNTQTVLVEIRAMSIPQKASPNVWFITGTSSGFGLHLVRTALARGDNVIATARPASLPKLISAISDFSKSNPNIKNSCVALELDVTSDLESIKKVAEEAICVWGKVNVVVNNAGYIPFSPLI